jgi:4-hydroxy-tetrahydrodipicolinate synthase
MKENIFRGVATALITPFSDAEIDYASLRRIIDMQLDSGVSALVIGGTTGEISTLTDLERDKLYRFVCEYVGGRAKLILGIGTNDTRKSIAYAEKFNSLSHDGYLVITPYYNKGTSDGIVEHYRQIARATSHSIVLYNVPSRTGVNLNIEQIEKLTDEENIVAIKEASDSAKRLVVLSSLSKKITSYAGCDTQIYTNLALGGGGVISVISNLVPSRVVKLCNAYFGGRHKEALEEQLALLPLAEEAFRETNPAPIKAMMSRAGLCKNELRLPLTPC